MAVEAKDAELLLLRKQLENARATTPESLQESTVPTYFHYNTGFTYDEFNNLCAFFKLPNSPDAPHTPIPLTYKRVDCQIPEMPFRSQFLLTLINLRQNFDYKDLAQNSTFQPRVSATCLTPG